jgi:tetratricopeptide (TPR) repeat protein
MLRTACLTILFLATAPLLQAQQEAQQVTPSIASIESQIRAKAYDQALLSIKASLRQTPKDVRLLTLEGVVLSIKGNNAEAVDAFDQALQVSTGYPAALRGEVQLLYVSHDKRAIPLLLSILKADPEDQTAHEMLGVLEKIQGDCPGSVAQFASVTDALKMHRESLEAYGECLMQTGKLQEAVPVFKKLVALAPERIYPKYDLAVVYVATKQPEAALNLLEPLLTSGTPDPELLSLASDAYEATGNTPKAVSTLRQAIVINPANSAYYTQFASLCMNHDSFQVGIDMINAGLLRLPNEALLYVARGMLFAQLAQFDKAEADFNKAEQLDSSQSISAFATDLSELLMYHDDQTLGTVREQLKVHPDSPLLHYILAKLLSDSFPPIESKEFHEAVASAKKAVQLNPNLVEARDILASMYTRSGQHDLAMEECRLALQSSPDDQAAIYHLITALRQAGRGKSDEMQAMLKRLSDLQKVSLQKENERKRYKLVEESTSPP